VTHRAIAKDFPMESLARNSARGLRMIPVEPITVTEPRNMFTEPIWNVMLVVSDDANARETIAADFKRRAFDAIASSSVAAIELARQARPGLVVLDLDPAAAAHIARQIRALPGLDHAFIVALADGAGVSHETAIDEYVHKPVGAWIERWPVQN
jgi:CheY-like chemotaxis protein